MDTTRWTLVLVLSVAAASQGEDAPAAPDLARGVIDPFSAGVQGSKFNLAAGVDSEMNKEEFDADLAKGDGFGRAFDKWEALLRFDKDKNGTIDSLEAIAYRDDLRARFLAEYDADGNK